MKIIIIAALSENNVIGMNGGVPWQSSPDMSHFKETTLGFPVIMGRKTFESIGTPLKERLNIIITTHPELFIKFRDVKCFLSLNEALVYCKGKNFSKVFIAGGGMIYKEAIGIADEMILSRMNFECQGDTYFPHIEPSIWEVKEKRILSDFQIITYRKI